ncbi:hypothetical protein [Desulfosporosinus shakirovi]|uniref:hypothetical protein n=1 Tax=Desulfosporosinus shakirovi TaxID=2885154 RepID=UPI001E2C4776|nr:hypothetical protein [Desulfosporosinus sp. SRJS8]MCB8817697.1 hypothetical protein [Desulfosporosinus sp. SRJS8]
MNRKKLIIGTTLAIFLCTATSVFAWSMGMSNNLSTGISITGYSVTTATETCSSISAYNGIYEDGVLKANNQKEETLAKSAKSLKNSTPNHLGTQKWESYGIHNAVCNGEVLIDSTLKTANY